jgi:hypothetical protein
MMQISMIARGISSSLIHTLSTVVIFQVRAAEPEKDIGAEMTTFSDASLFLVI